MQHQLNDRPVFKTALAASLLSISVMTLAPSVSAVPLEMFVAHTTTAGDHVISRIDEDGNVLDQFGGGKTNQFRSHITVSGDYLYRTNSSSPDADIDQFTLDGTLVREIIPNSSVGHRTRAIARDFDNESVFFVDIDAGSNVVRHLDDAATGAQTLHSIISYAGVAGMIDLDFGGPAGNEALYALTPTHPLIAPGTGAAVSRIDESGSVTLIRSSSLDIPFSVDVGAISVDPVTGTIHVATSTTVVSFDTAGNELGSFATTAGGGKPSLDVDFASNIYMGNFGLGEIDVFSSTGDVLRTISIAGAARVLDIFILEGSLSEATDVPAPGTLALLGLGLVAMRRKQRPQH